MATSSGPSVVVSREHFEVLLRRANVEYLNFFPAEESVVCIPLVDYEALTKCQDQHETLKRNLMVSGMTAENLAVLCEEDITAEAQARATTNPAPPPSQAAFAPQHEGYMVTPQRKETIGGAKLNQTPWTPNPKLPQHTPLPQPTTQATGGSPMGPGAARNSGSDFQPGSEGMRAQLASPDSPIFEISCHSADAPGPEVPGSRVVKKKYPLVAKRTLFLANVPLGVTFWDVTSVIRGGPLADVFLRNMNRYAIISFLSDEDAKAFFEYAEKNGLYIKNHKIVVTWALRQFSLTPHIAQRAADGATRNLIIRNCHSGLSASMIRADLEHIHGLTVIKIDVDGNDYHIKTNSIHHALFAKSCMQSRLMYKSSHIIWDVDECDQPLETTQETQAKQMAQPTGQQPTLPKKPLFSMQNRFASLNFSESGDGDMSDEKGPAT
ncbi:hypothetical protein F5Y13DRAFT_198533 [Hypoxylon sp. FL1857]|nr:hypothetical protein F5Y13DRAFT_198533 [Hypoxylon sp. FL1857]